MLDRLYNLFIILLILITPLPALAHASSSPTDNHMSGGSIALIVIVSSFLILFFTYRILIRVLNKD